MKAAERYRALLDIGESLGVVPQMEVWGFSQNIRLLSEAAFVAMQSGHPRACVLADVFHLYKGGSDLNGLRFLRSSVLPVFHMNDYPAEPPRDNPLYKLFRMAARGVVDLRERVSGRSPS